MLCETDFLVRHTAGSSLPAFLEDETLERAFGRSLEIIGEAARRVPEET